MTKLPELSNSLQELLCYNNKLTELPELPDSLQILDCNCNKLLKLPKLPNSLQKLICSNNNLLSLSLLPLTLELLNFKNNIIYNIIYNEISDDEISVEQLNIINRKLEILNNFKLLYYCLKFKNKLRKWLWMYVRESKIQELCHPSLLSNLLYDDMNEETFENTINSFGKIAFN